MTDQIVIYTSNYARKGNHLDAVSISVAVPRWYPGLSHFPALAPTWDIVKQYKDNPDAKKYAVRYLDLLDSRKLNPREIAQSLNGKIMLCYEKPSDFCHRHLAAWWLEHETDHEVIVKEILDPTKDKLGKYNVLLNIFS